MDWMGIVTPEMEARLQVLHNAPGRYYHVWSHPLSMHRIAFEHRKHIVDMPAVLAMIAFHDAVYDSGANDNEEQSARLAADMLSATASKTTIAFVCTGILATKKHLVSGDLPLDQQRDIALLLDIDLSILGAPEDEFDDFDAKVRQEYSWVGDDHWRIGRAAVMRAFSQRPSIYHTEEFRRQFEDGARRNISRLLAKLDV
jgi:Uncharacterized protein conserved in bacteria